MVGKKLRFNSHVRPQYYYCLEKADFYILYLSTIMIYAVLWKKKTHLGTMENRNAILIPTCLCYAPVSYFQIARPAPNEDRPSFRVVIGHYLWICMVGMLSNLAQDLVKRQTPTILKKNVKLREFRSPGILTHWGRVTHICVSKLIVSCPDDTLLPGRSQAIIWNNAGILLFET